MSREGMTASVVAGSGYCIKEEKTKYEKREKRETKKVLDYFLSYFLFSFSLPT